MAFGPNFADVVQLEGDTLKVSGETTPHPRPVDLQIYLDQDGTVASTKVQRFSEAWTTELPSDGFKPGPAVAFGVEIRTQPFQATAWTEVVTIQ